MKASIHIRRLFLLVVGIMVSQAFVRGAPSPSASSDAVGATNAVFWSFRPLSETALPKIQSTDRIATPIDRFVLAKLEKEKLTLAARVDRRRLIRRAYFDLIGLPPSPAEVEAFVTDPSPQAYETLLDQLLASPHYGERWGRHWLDVARFGESHGFEHDYDRPHAYHYRDFVIEALNRDLPYDQFVRWQIAGDELNPDEPLAWKATGFLAAGTHATQITANQAEKERYDELDDLARTIGASMLGLSIGCARCHDHKFDPISAEEYYRFIATFTTTVRSVHDLPVDREAFARQHDAWATEHEPLVEALRRYEKEDLPARLAVWEQTGEAPALPSWLVLDQARFESKGGATFTALPDGSFLAGGDNPDFDTYTITATLPITGVTAIKLEALSDASLVKGGPGRAGNGNFALTDLTLRVAASSADEDSHNVNFRRASATFEQKGLPVEAVIDQDAKSAWAIDPQFGTNHAALFELSEPLMAPAGSVLTFTLKFDNNHKHSMGRVRLALTVATSPALDGTDDSMRVAVARRVLSLPRAQRTESEQSALLEWFRANDDGWRAAREKVETHARLEPRQKMESVLVASEGLPAVRLHTQGPDFYEQTYWLARGDLGQKLSPVEPGYLRVLMHTPEGEAAWRHEPPENSRTPSRRSALAHWLTDVDRGAGALLARVIVNRLWQHHFGRGLVATPDDFGTQGMPPTHPELLDWLAGELIRQQWRLKPMHKLMMRSAVYLQDSSNLKDETSMDHPSHGRLVDPDNRWLWQYPRRRLEAEIIRDNILAVSGVLDPAMFGPGSLDEGMKRRSIYFTVKRSQLIPMMVQFDWPDSLQSLGRRVPTTVAPQALLLMNNPHVRAAAGAFAQRVIAKVGTEADASIRSAYALALGRPPDEVEWQNAAGFLQEQTAAYAGEAQAAERALTDFCQALFALNEFLYVQ